MNLSLSEKQEAREVSDRKADLINALYRMGVSTTPDGRKLEDVRLYTLEHVHITAKCNVARRMDDELR